MRRTRPTALIPEASVSDVRRSLAFYRDVLGLAVEYDRPEEGFSFLSLGGAHLMIDRIGVGRDFAVPEGAPVEHPFGRGLNLRIRVPHCGRCWTG